ncbi:MAG: hypothetical protein R2685_11000 [Candidatus Nitrosocosmicus sp.]|nr:hypothetical protein [Candidatus Nitrosocosmicus sp.]
MQQANIKTLMIEGINQLGTTRNLIIVSLTLLASLAFAQFAHGAEFAQYGSIGQEDQLTAQDSNGLYYVNTGNAYGIGNGMFEQVNEINEHFTIDGAIKTFGIYEDTQAFIYEPVLSNGKYSNVLFMYELVAFNHFELTAIYEDESGIDQQVTQLENNI